MLEILTRNLTLASVFDDSRSLLYVLREKVLQEDWRTIRQLAKSIWQKEI